MRRVYLALLACLAATCGSADPPPRGISVVTPTDNAPMYAVMSGLSREEQQAIRRATLNDESWPLVFRVAVQGTPTSGPAISGTYALTGEEVRFTPAFPFEAGRSYDLTFDPTKIPGAAIDRPPLTMTFSVPAAAATEPVSVANVFPSGGVWPENQLRVYIQFSGPMARKAGGEFIALLDEQGNEVKDPFLPLDTELWNDDHTRYTVFFDPGRVKRGILPNRQIGPSLVAGRRYTLVVRKDWPDAGGRTLREEFRRTFTVGPPDAAAIDPRAWRIAMPPAGTRDPLVVRFDQPLDRGLLFRALGVRRDGRTLLGTVDVSAEEMRWTFTPQETWTAGAYELLALSVLEDPCGNRIGRPFETESDPTRPADDERAEFTVPFRVR